MVAINPFSYEQITIIFIFLSALVGILLFVRYNRGKLRFKLQPEKSIYVYEDTSISPTERLRIIQVGSETVLMSSVKGQPPQFIKLNPENIFLKDSEAKSSISSQRTDIAIDDTATIKPTLNSILPQKSGAESTSSKTPETQSIFDAIKQARNKNPLLGLNK
jgi:flagellar biogenesis protein FliO